MAWRLAKSLMVLRDEVNDRAPQRSKVSDGTLGDPAHAARKSDHNPNSAGVVCAIDITDDPAHGHDDRVFAEHIRLLGAAGFPPLQHGGYVIANGRVAGGSRGWEWRPYTGPNAHAKHTHISANHAPGYDLTLSWGWFPAPKPLEEEDVTDADIAKIAAKVAEALTPAFELRDRVYWAPTLVAANDAADDDDTRATRASKVAEQTATP